MLDLGMLYRIDRNQYHIIPLNRDPHSYEPHPYQAAKYFMNHREYYFAYSTALEFHGLLPHALHEEKINKLKVVTLKQMKPSIRQIGGTTLHFIQHHPRRFFGQSEHWINISEKAMVSDLEKSLVDLATKPVHGLGIGALGNAILHAQKYLNYEKLWFYFVQNGNLSAMKRFLFLTEFIGLEWTKDHEKLLKHSGTGLFLLDPSLPRKGKIHGKMGLKINVDLHALKKCVFL